MTRETYYLGAYWGARAESPEQIYERTSSMLGQMAECHPLLAVWHEQAETFEEALRLAVEPSVERLGPLFTTMEPDEPLRFGYRLTLWNGRKAESERCLVEVRAGMVPASSGLCNLVLLDLNPDYSIEPSMHTPETVARLLTIVVRIWRPDFACVMSDAYDEQYEYSNGTLPTPGKPSVGWMTYLRSERLDKLPDVIPCPTVPVDDIGVIFVANDVQRFTVDNAEDVERAQSLTAFLSEYDALEVTPTNIPM